MADFIANLRIFLSISAMGLALILTVVSLLSWKRMQSRRALFIGLGFLALGIQGAFLVQRSYALVGSDDWLLPVASLDLASLVFLYLALRLR